MSDISQYVGIGAGILTSVSMLPQLFKIIKEKKADDISYVMLFVLMTGIGGWAWYGVLKEDILIIIFNSFSFLVNLVIIFFSVKYKKG
ncbi:MAG: SemiSWEET transporter [Chitinophagaceae bacterium]